MSESESNKTCGRCRKVLSITCFRQRKGRKNFSSYCLQCDREYKQQHKEQSRAASKRRRMDKEKKIHDALIHKRYNELNREKTLFLNARKRARDMGLEFDLEESWIKIPERCPLLGIKISFLGRMNNRDSSASVDRIDPRKGYTKDNVWIISYRANRIKNDASVEELGKVFRGLKRMLKNKASQSEQ